MDSLQDAEAGKTNKVTPCTFRFKKKKKKETHQFVVQAGQRKRNVNMLTDAQ